MLGEIMDRAYERTLEKPGEAPQIVSRETLEEGGGPEQPPPPPEKNKRASVYVYLAVLFGAAFLMLLLAYFVQQRNSAAAMDDLRMTTNASREELLERLKTLEEENGALAAENRRLEEEADQANRRYAEEQERTAGYTEQLAKVNRQLLQARVLGQLERFINEKDYLMAACVAENCDYLFNPRNGMYLREPAPSPAQADRYLELRGWLEEHGHLLVYQYSAQADGGNYIEQPAAAQGQEANATQESRDAAVAAKNLWGIFYCYLEENPEAAGMLTACFYDPEMGNDSQSLNEDTFQPSTLALFEGIKGELLEQGWLAQTEEGLRYAENGTPVEIPKGVLEGAGDGYEPLTQQ